MTGDDEHRSKWDELNHNHCPNRFAERTRWHVGTMAREMFPDAQVGDEAEAWLRRLERQQTAQAEGWHSGEPGA